MWKMLAGSRTQATKLGAKAMRHARARLMGCAPKFDLGPSSCPASSSPDNAEYDSRFWGSKLYAAGYDSTLSCGEINGAKSVKLGLVQGLLPQHASLKTSRDMPIIDSLAISVTRTPSSQ